jgi:hypothetical protein
MTYEQIKDLKPNDFKRVRCSSCSVSRYRCAQKSHSYLENPSRERFFTWLSKVSSHSL